jgi:hypothetical protein
MVEPVVGQKDVISAILLAAAAFAGLVLVFFGVTIAGRDRAEEMIEKDAADDVPTSLRTPRRGILSEAARKAESGLLSKAEEAAALKEARHALQTAWTAIDMLETSERLTQLSVIGFLASLLVVGLALWWLLMPVQQLFTASVVGFILLLLYLAVVVLVVSSETVNWPIPRLRQRQDSITARVDGLIPVPK